MPWPDLLAGISGGASETRDSEHPAHQLVRQDDDCVGDGMRFSSTKQTETRHVEQAFPKRAFVAIFLLLLL